MEENAGFVDSLYGFVFLVLADAYSILASYRYNSEIPFFLSFFYPSPFPKISILLQDHNRTIHFLASWKWVSSPFPFCSVPREGGCLCNSILIMGFVRFYHYVWVCFILCNPMWRLDFQRLIINVGIFWVKELGLEILALQISDTVIQLYFCFPINGDIKG